MNDWYINEVNEWNALISLWTDILKGEEDGFKSVRNQEQGIDDEVCARLELRI